MKRLFLLLTVTSALVLHLASAPAAQEAPAAAPAAPAPATEDAPAAAAPAPAAEAAPAGAPAPLDDEKTQLLQQAGQKVRALMQEEKFADAARVLSETAGKLGEHPAGDQLRYDACRLMLHGYRTTGQGQKELQGAIATFLKGAAKERIEQAYIAAASLYADGQSYELVRATLNEYLKKFPPPTAEEIKQFETELKAARPDAAGRIAHPRIMGRQAAEQILKRISVVGEAPPPFELTTLDDKKIAPKDFKGKVLMLDFWATWCGPCREELPRLKELYAKHHAEGFEIVGLSADRDKETLAEFIKKEEVPWPQVFLGEENGLTLGDAYHVYGIPALFLVGRDGKLRLRDARGTVFEAELERLLKEKPPAAAAE